MKKGLVLLAFALMSWSTAGSAFAGPFGRFARGNHQQQQQRPQQEDAHEGEKNNPNVPQPVPGAREGGEARQGGGAPGAQPGAHGGARMSIEERQRLRRQINEAGRSLYNPSSGNK